LTNSGLPAILVATKCENPKDEWEVIPDVITGSKFYQSCLASYKLSSENPEVARACLQAILKAAIIHRRGKSCLGWVGLVRDVGGLTLKYRRKRRDSIPKACPIEPRNARYVVNALYQ
jgi:hypothetical protein